MHYSPGAPILKSYDLVNWKFIGHSVPTLSWSSKYDMANDQTAYVKGTVHGPQRCDIGQATSYGTGSVALNSPKPISILPLQSQVHGS